MKVAIVHYWLITRRGGEKVIESLLKIYPDADIYTLFYNHEAFGEEITSRSIYTSKLNFALFKKHYQKLFPFYPLAVKTLRLRKKYDLVISSESGPAKGVTLPEGALHICYIHTPMRYCWGFREDYLQSMPKMLRPVANYFFQRLQNWDKTTIQNVDYYIANSQNVANRVSTFYNREAEVIYPPIDLSIFEEEPTSKVNDSYYLSFGALTPYKRIDLLVDTFNRNGERLIVIGDGSERSKLEIKARNNITFTGSLPWKQIADLIRNSKALIFPGEEDFGMIPLEVMALGVPVIAYAKGGALETVIEDKVVSQSTGIFFYEQSVPAIDAALKYFDEIKDGFDPLFIRKHARKFGEDIFIEKFKNFISQKKNSIL